MKTSNLIKLTVVAATFATLTVRANIIGSPHDFTGEAWNVRTADPNTVCGVCHTPHHASITAGPLWNHETAPALAFTMYANPVNGVGGAPGANLKIINQSSQPNPSSLACLSCHDGVIAVNSYGVDGNAPVPQGGNGVTVPSKANLTRDLTHSHPISFTYDNALFQADKWLNDPDNTTVQSPVSSAVAWNAPVSMNLNRFLLNGNHTVECSSCHDVHAQEGSAFNLQNNPNLVKIIGVDAGQNGSLLCRACHNK